MGAAEDIVGEIMQRQDEGKPPTNMAESMRTGEGLNKPAAKPPVLPNAEDGELNWVQRMAKQVHDYFVRQKSAKKTAAAPEDVNDVNNLNNTSSRY